MKWTILLGLTVTLLVVPSSPVALGETKNDDETYFLQQQAKATELKNKLVDNPGDIEARHKLIFLYIVELDKPKEAGELLTKDVQEPWQTYVPLSTRAVSGLKEGECKKLGDWYSRELQRKATSYSKARMLIHAKAYYEQFLGLHKRPDLARTVVSAGLKRVAAHLAKLNPQEQAANESTLDNIIKKHLPLVRSIKNASFKDAPFNPGGSAEFNYRTNGISRRDAEILKRKRPMPKVSPSPVPALSWTLEYRQYADAQKLMTGRGLQTLRFPAAKFLLATKGMPRDGLGKYFFILMEPGVGNRHIVDLRFDGSGGGANSPVRSFCHEMRLWGKSRRWQEGPYWGVARTSADYAAVFSMIKQGVEQYAKQDLCILDVYAYSKLLWEADLFTHNYLLLYKKIQRKAPTNEAQRKAIRAWTIKTMLVYCKKAVASPNPTKGFPENLSTYLWGTSIRQAASRLTRDFCAKSTAPALFQKKWVDWYGTNPPEFSELEKLCKKITAIQDKYGQEQKTTRAKDRLRRPGPDATR